MVLKCMSFCVTWKITCTTGGTHDCTRKWFLKKENLFVSLNGLERNFVHIIKQKLK